MFVSLSLSPRGRGRPDEEQPPELAWGRGSPDEEQPPELAWGGGVRSQEDIYLRNHISRGSFLFLIFLCFTGIKGRRFLTMQI